MPQDSNNAINTFKLGVITKRGFVEGVLDTALATASNIQPERRIANTNIKAGIITSVRFLASLLDPASEDRRGAVGGRSRQSKRSNPYGPDLGVVDCGLVAERRQANRRTDYRFTKYTTETRDLAAGKPEGSLVPIQDPMPIDSSKTKQTIDFDSLQSNSQKSKKGVGVLKYLSGEQR